MLAYIIRRLMLIPLTLLGIMIINFAIVQFAPGGPVEQVIAQIQGTAVESTARIAGPAGGDEAGGGRPAGESEASPYRGARGLDPAIVAEIERRFGFDRPAHERFVMMLGSYATFDFGESFFKGRPVIELILDKMPVSISLGLWSTLVIYLVSIPLGIAKAVRDGTRFDLATSTVLIVLYSIPSFLLAVLLQNYLATGGALSLFPHRGLVSSGWDEMSLGQQVLDYLWHMVLPIAAIVVGGFAGLTMLTKNSFIEEINKQYVLTARAKGLTDRRVLYGHVFRNAMIIVIAGFPSALIGILFTGALFIEVIFSLDGLGLLGWEAAINRDYPVMFATVYIFALLALLLTLVRDVTYALVDPRIDFERREV